MSTRFYFWVFLFGVFSCGTSKISPSKKLPNVILLMADDMGYECLASNGSTEYNTPVLDAMAERGLRFTNFHAQPLCTPSRVKIMTGMYNYKNYTHFGYLDRSQYTFGSLMKEANYKTCIVGKWQLNGLNKNDPDNDDSQRPNQFGFDEYCLWQLTQTRAQGERFADPLIEQNGKLLDLTIDDYGPDVFCEYAIDFISRKKESPFFIYYPMVLVHDPFVPTPDSEAWSNRAGRHENDTAYFKDMVEYTDKIVGRLLTALERNNLIDNTLFIFLADNGTGRQIMSNTLDGVIPGSKGRTIRYGTHVPSIMQWPNVIRAGQVNSDLWGIQDIYPTLGEIVGRENKVDGKSLLPALLGRSVKTREAMMIYYDPRHSQNANKHRDLYAFSHRYKLYQDGRFFDLEADPFELNAKVELSDLELEAKEVLEKELEGIPRISK